MTEPALTTTQLWRALRAHIEQTCTAFGLPSTLARLLWLTRLQHKHICTWLRPLEALLRRLIFIDAYALALTAPDAPPPEAKARLRLGMPAAFGAAFDADNSESWRVSFSARLPMQRPSAHRTAQAPSASLNAVSSAPCALRLEGLIRALNMRQALAERLARQLRHEAARVRYYIQALDARLAARPLWREVADAVALCQRALMSPAVRADSS